MKPISDQAARSRALDPQTSFIVQAPAGSGKTELLTQRFLRLLSTVKSPEEIIAITFTQKAASEMRERIIDALTQADTQPEPEPAHKKLTWSLATKALQHSKKNLWQLLANPSRLRILTIDALALHLTNCAPLLSEMGCQPAIIEDPNPLYRAAMESLLKQTKENKALQQSLSNLLLHIDNRVEYLIDLCCFMLGKREQWLPTIFKLDRDEAVLRQYLEQGLEQITVRALHNLKQTLKQPLLSELLTITTIISKQLSEPDHPLKNLAAQATENNFESATISAWQALANLLLTKDGRWRKTFTAKQGCPPKSEQKTQLIALIATVQDQYPLQQALQSLQLIPPTHYQTEQWQVLQDLLVVLPYLVACLRVEMQQRAQIDFTEISLAALRALGENEQPTDLALYLDYQIQHLLIDEFQDTSTMQFHLFSQLISQWQPDEGKTVFLVGDPMQSIYRFRNAEVGLFLTAQQQGIANLPLEFLQLQQNFRSSPAIVEWINHSFAAIMPNKVDIATGAVPYSQATAAQNLPGSIHYYSASTSTGSCPNKIAALLLSIPKTQSVVILVRSRSQLHDIIPILQADKIQYNALDIQSLSQCSEIQDCLSVTKAYLHFDDTIAWLALLRAPFVGLTLADIHAISQIQKAGTLWQKILIAVEEKCLSTDGLARLRHLHQAFTQAITQSGRHTITETIELIWNRLLADKLLSTTQQDNIERFFQLLLQLENSADGITLTSLEDKIQQLYASNNNNSNIHIMTIHKSKGLEFDHVILPQLEKKPASNSAQLLQWLEQPNIDNDFNLILAPLKSYSPNADPIYDYCRLIEKQKLQLESTRLMYVACTRARQSLHLFCNLNLDDNGETLPPAKNSMLSKLWPQHQHDFLQNILTSEPLKKTSGITLNSTGTFTRIVSKELITNIDESNLQASRKPFKLSPNSLTDISRINGTIIHTELQLIAETGLEKWNINKISQQRRKWLYQLQANGIFDVEQQRTALQTIATALQNTVNSQRGQWCLSQDHEAAFSEYPISHKADCGVEHLILDRFIINQGTSWVIDFKTSQPQQQTPSAFLNEQEQRHRPQLEKYANAIAKIHPQPVKCALFFPLFECHWLEISLD